MTGQVAIVLLIQLIVTYLLIVLLVYTNCVYYINCLGGGAWSEPDPGVITLSTLGTVQGS